MNKHLVLYSQTLQPDDDPQEGDIVAFAVYQGDTMQRCWVLAEGLREECNEVVEPDALGVTRVMRKNLTSFEASPPSEEALESFLKMLLEGYPYTEIKPWQFKLFTPSADE